MRCGLKPGRERCTRLDARGARDRTTSAQLPYQVFSGIGKGFVNEAWNSFLENTRVKEALHSAFAHPALQTPQAQRALQRFETVSAVGDSPAERASAVFGGFSWHALGAFVGATGAVRGVGAEAREALSGASVVEGASGGPGARGIYNRGGRFADLDAAKLDGEVAHHMPQNALNRRLGLSRADGPALGMRKEDHELTRTMRYKGAATARQEASMGPRERLLKDIRDNRVLFGRRYNRGMQEQMQYARSLPQFDYKIR